MNSFGYIDKPTPDRALIWLMDNQSGATTGQIARLLRVTSRSAGMALMRLHEEGWVVFEDVRETDDPRGRRWRTRLWRFRG